MYIRPVSDLRNKFPEIEQCVLKEDSAVKKKKNGYGSMVLLSMERYEKLIKEERYSEYVEYMLDEADKEAADPNSKTYTHEEMFNMLRRNLNGEKLQD